MVSLRGYNLDKKKYDDMLEHNYGVKMNDTWKESIYKQNLKKDKNHEINTGNYNCEFELNIKAKIKIIQS